MQPIKLNHELQISLQELVDINIYDLVEEINEISDISSRERKIED